MATAEQMADLTARVLDRYAHDLETASDEQFAHLAERAESLPCSPFSDRCRQLVDWERGVRVVLEEADR